MSTRIVALSVTVTCLLIAGCARDYTLGRAIESEGAGLAEIGAEWTRGDDMVADGRSDVERGKALIEKGERLVDKGKAKISKGKAVRSDAEDAYREQTGKALPEL